MDFQNVLINTCLGLLAVLLFGFLCLYLWFLYIGCKIKREGKKFLKNKGKDLINKGIETGVSKFQQKLNEEIRKKNEK